MDSHNFHVLTDMLKARGALKAVTAGDMGLSGNAVPFLEIGHIPSHLDNLGRKFVAKEKG
jgi:hypothetical protein